MSHATQRLLLTGPFNADHHDRALDALCARADAGARDILYIVASGAAKRRAIADLLARRNAVFGLRVVTLRSLSDELFRRAHAIELDRIDGVIDDLLVERALRVATAGTFSAATPLRGLASKLASTIDLLERLGATAEQLEGFIHDHKHGEGARVLTQAWKNLDLTRPVHGATDSARLSAADELLRSNTALLAGVDVLMLEDLPLLTPVERSIVRSLLSAAPSNVIASLGHVRRLPNAGSTRSLERLREMAAWEEVECEANRSQFVQRLFGVNPKDNAPAATVRLLEAAGDVGEVRLVARVVRRHLDAGVPPEQIVLIVHSNDNRYRELVREVFFPLGVPVAATIPRTVADTGIGSVLLRLLDLAIVPGRMTRETSLAVARAPHIDLYPDDGDKLQHQVTIEGFLGLDGWDDLATETLGAEATNRINRLKRAVATARSAFESVTSALDAARVVRQLAKELRLKRNAYDSRRRVIQRSDPSDALATSSGAAVREDNIAWEAIDDALDVTVPEMLEIDRVSTGKRGLDFATAWLAMLGRALSETTVTPVHAPAHAVQFRGTGPGCDAPARITIVLGMLEKSFPRQPRQDPFLDDELRATLRAVFGWELATSTDTVDRERECFIRAVSSATETLYLSYSSIDADGRPAVRSFFIDDLQTALGAGQQLPIERLNGATAIVPVGEAATSTDLVTSIAHDIWQYLPRTTDSVRRRAMAFRALAALVRREADVAVVRHGRRVSQKPALEGVLPADAPHLTLTLSASQLKLISHCTYKHFVEKVLDPTNLVPPEYNALGKGKLIHDAIMHWATTLRGWTRGEAALGELHEWFHAQIAEWSPAMRGKDRTSRATDADLDRLDELLREELAIVGTADVAQPTFAELAFGAEMEARGPRDPASRLEPFEMSLPTSKGISTVKFRGSMDRVDVVTVGDKRYGVIIDYKTGRTSKRYADDMMNGKDLQLRLYLLILEQFWGIIPVGALYLGFGDGVRRGVVRSDLAGRIAGIEDDAVDIYDHDEWNELITDTRERIAKLVDRLVRLDVTVAPRDHDCGFCELESICRYDRWASEGSGG